MPNVRVITALTCLAVNCHEKTDLFHCREGVHYFHCRGNHRATVHLVHLIIAVLLFLVLNFLGDATPLGSRWLQTVRSTYIDDVRQEARLLRVTSYMETLQPSRGQQLLLELQACLSSDRQRNIKREIMLQCSRVHIGTFLHTCAYAFAYMCCMYVYVYVCVCMHVCVGVCMGCPFF